jgi:hypothetical protein
MPAHKTVYDNGPQADCDLSPVSSGLPVSPRSLSHPCEPQPGVDLSSRAGRDPFDEGLNALAGQHNRLETIALDDVRPVNPALDWPRPEYDPLANF